MKNLRLMDETKIIVPDLIDISKVGYFDEMEYELWDTIKGYLELFGIVLAKPFGDPDWATVKAVQDKIIQVLQEAGVDFKINATDNREVVNAEFPVVLLDTDIEHIMHVALDGGIVHWCGEFESSGKAPGEPFRELTCNGMITFTDNKTGDWLELTKEDFISGFQQYLKNPTSADILEFIDHQLRVDLNTVDSKVADAIIQYAVFGEIRY